MTASTVAASAFLSSAAIGLWAYPAVVPGGPGAQTMVVAKLATLAYAASATASVSALWSLLRHRERPASETASGDPSLQQRLDRLEAENSQLLRLATHDHLTGLPNRAVVLDRLEQALAATARHGGTCAVLFCDVDGFKGVNDRYGHRAGDEVLVAVADRLSGIVRRSDTVGRFGGDEFVLVVPSFADGPGWKRVVRAIDEAMAAPIRIEDGPTVTVSLSVGAEVVGGDAAATADAKQILAGADATMFAAKRRGRSRPTTVDADSSSSELVSARQ